jgi:hypothetical protein
MAPCLSWWQANLFPKWAPKIIPPQMPMAYVEIISVILAGSVIREGFGKLSAIFIYLL